MDGAIRKTEAPQLEAVKPFLNIKLGERIRKNFVTAVSERLGRKPEEVDGIVEGTVGFIQELVDRIDRDPPLDSVKVWGGPGHFGSLTGEERSLAIEYVYVRFKFRGQDLADEMENAPSQTDPDYQAFVANLIRSTAKAESAIVTDGLKPVDGLASLEEVHVGTNSTRWLYLEKILNGWVEFGFASSGLNENTSGLRKFLKEDGVWGKKSKEAFDNFDKLVKGF